MNLFINFFVVLLLFPLHIHADTYRVKEIKEDFHTKVVLEPLYSLYYKKYLDAACKKPSESCHKTERAKLMQMISVEESPIIQRALKRRDKKFQLSKQYWKQAQARLLKEKKAFSASQFISLIDLSKQVYILVLWNNEKKVFYPIGFDFISSGNIEKEIKVVAGEDHFLKTPSGLFSVQSGWRSDGKTLDDKTTLPYGDKGSYIFYFGKQKSVRYDTFDKNGKKIKDKKRWKLISDNLDLALHTHKSKAELGKPNSHGCIRINNELNVFLDNNLIFFRKLYNDKRAWTHPNSEPPKKPKNYQLAGQYMLVVDKI